MRSEFRAVCLPEKLESWREAVLGLAHAVHEADPTFLPAVTAGEETVEGWFFNKSQFLRQILIAEDHTVIGHVGLSQRKMHGRDFEVGRLLVHPSYRKRGLGKRLLNAFPTYHGLSWASTWEKSDSHRLMLASEWTPLGTMAYADDPRLGMVLGSQG